MPGTGPPRRGASRGVRPASTVSPFDPTRSERASGPSEPTGWGAIAAGRSPGRREAVWLLSWSLSRLWWQHPRRRVRRASRQPSWRGSRPGRPCGPRRTDAGTASLPLPGGEAPNGFLALGAFGHPRSWRPPATPKGGRGSGRRDFDRRAGARVGARPPNSAPCNLRGASLDGEHCGRIEANVGAVIHTPRLAPPGPRNGRRHPHPTGASRSDRRKLAPKGADDCRGSNNTRAGCPDPAGRDRRTRVAVVALAARPSPRWFQSDRVSGQGGDAAGTVRCRPARW